MKMKVSHPISQVCDYCNLYIGDKAKSIHFKENHPEVLFEKNKHLKCGYCGKMPGDSFKDLVNHYLKLHKKKNHYLKLQKKVPDFDTLEKKMQEFDTEQKKAPPKGVPLHKDDTKFRIAVLAKLEQIRAELAVANELTRRKSQKCRWLRAILKFGKSPQGPIWGDT